MISPEEQSDDLLIAQVVLRDPAALGALYDRWGRLVYSLALGIVRNAADAEEVTQDVFLRIWENAEYFDLEIGSPSSWLTVIARRLAIDRTRSRSYRASHRELDIHAPDWLDGSSGVTVPESVVTKHVQEREVREALDRLDQTHREVIVLSYYQGMSHSRIATHLSTPLGTVKTRLREAIRHLRTMLDVEARRT